MDAKSAFLNGDLKKEIFIKILPEQDRPKRHVWWLRKILYGLNITNKILTGCDT